MTKRRIAILGSVGVPSSYGGFETLADNLVTYHGATGLDHELTVYCSARAFDTHPETYKTARLRYLPLAANGPQSIPYDVISLIDAVRQGHDRLLLLGVSGALFLPILRAVSRARIVTNLDGIEWERAKWRGLARLILRASERAAIRYSHDIITDNEAIADYVRDRYGADCTFIPYGGDNALEAAPDASATRDLPDRYHLAICRIEPENNVATILEAFDKLGTPLVFVGNWEATPLGRTLKAKYEGHRNIILRDPVYDPAALHAIRDRAIAYVHGHSAGGTNPSLVEIMHFGIPVFAHGCIFNRKTTEDNASYFMNAAELESAVREMTPETATRIGKAMRDVARRRYTWSQIGKAYFDLLEA